VAAEKGLIAPTERDRRIAEYRLALTRFKTNNLTAKDKKAIDEREKIFVGLLEDLGWSKVGISKSQIRELGEAHLPLLVEDVARGAKIRAGLEWGATGLMTGGGAALSIFFADPGYLILSMFSAILIPYKGWRFLWHLRRLRKVHGKDYSPYKALHP